MAATEDMGTTNERLAYVESRLDALATSVSELAKAMRTLSDQKRTDWPPLIMSIIAVGGVGFALVNGMVRPLELGIDNVRQAETFTAKTLDDHSDMPGHSQAHRAIGVMVERMDQTDDKIDELDRTLQLEIQAVDDRSDQRRVAAERDADGLKELLQTRIDMLHGRHGAPRKHDGAVER